MFSTAGAQTKIDWLKATVTLTNADSAGVLLIVPRASQTILVKDIILYYDNAANTNGIYAGIVEATAAQLRHYWIGESMGSGLNKTVRYQDINVKIDPTAAQAGIRLFVTAASSDSIFGEVYYELVGK